MPTVLDNRFPEIILSLQPRTKTGLKVAAEMIAEGARANAPVGRYPPHIRDAIHVEELEDDSGYTVMAGDDQVFWGHFVEFGTVKQPPRPFLLPAATAVLVEASVGTALKGL